MSAAPALPASVPPAVPPVAPPTPKASPPAPAPPSPLPRVEEVRHTGSARESSVRAARWVTQGSVKVLGDVDVEEGRLDGQTSVGGRCVAQRLDAHGSLEVLGDLVVADSLRTRGSLHVGGSLQAGELDHDGLLVVEGAARMTFGWKSRGEARVGGDVNAADLEFDGRLTVGGILTARRVEGRLTGESAVREIHAEEVVIRRPGGLFPTPRGSLALDRIEAKTAELEGVECEYVVAEELRLGPHSHVTAVEGRVVQRHQSSRVGPESRSAPPHGLTR
jgi:cytoskeletal protein CcmA (bactofilin family)